jgi:hypothetical protein
MLSEGIYKGEVQEWGLAASSKGTPYFYLQAKLTHRQGPVVAGKKTWEEIEGGPVRRTVPMYLTKGCMAGTASDLRSLGFEAESDDDVGRLDPGHEKAFDFSGKEVQVKIGHEEYPLGSGRISEKARLSRSVREIQALELPKDAMADLVAKMREQREGPAKGKSPEAEGEGQEAEPARRRASRRR